MLRKTLALPPCQSFTSIKAKSDQESTLAAYAGKGMAEAGLRRSVDGGGLTASVRGLLLFLLVFLAGRTCLASFWSTCPVDRLLWMLKAPWSTARKFLHSMRLTNRPL
jgi:hypothetical protein